MMLSIVICLGVALFLCYLAYYKRHVSGCPEVVCSDVNRRRLLQQHCPTLFQPFYPTIWLPLGIMQTVGRSLMQTLPKHSRRREVVWMNDGGHVCLDWYNEGSPSQPTVVILPGITGSSEESYVKHWIDDIVRQDCRCVVYTYRGCGGIKLSTTKLYCGAIIEDFIEVLDHICSALPSTSLLGLATSTGCFQLIKYLYYCKKSSKPCVLKAALLFSPIWDMKKTRDCLHCFINRHTLTRLMVAKYTGVIRENLEVFKQAAEKGKLSIDYHQTLRATCLESLVKSLLPMFGYASVEEYLIDWSACYLMDGITIPVLAVNAIDDPFSPPHAIPIDEAKKNPNLILAIFKAGGHNGFLDRFLPISKNLMDRILVQFIKAEFQHDL